MKLNHPALTDLLQRAYSAEKAAAFAYQGHASSIRNKEEKRAIRQIEIDEWNHRKEVLELMKLYDIPISAKYERQYHLIGKIISYSCYVIGWFMPYYFAGRLESGNVCEYFRMMQYFHECGINAHDDILYEMGMKEKDHEEYFLRGIKNHKLLPLFERFFSWGKRNSYNDIDDKYRLPVEHSSSYYKQDKFSHKKDEHQK